MWCLTNLTMKWNIRGDCRPKSIIVFKGGGGGLMPKSLYHFKSYLRFHITGEKFFHTKVSFLKIPISADLSCHAEQLWASLDSMVWDPHLCFGAGSSDVKRPKKAWYCLGRSHLCRGNAEDILSPSSQTSLNPCPMSLRGVKTLTVGRACLGCCCRREYCSLLEDPLRLLWLWSLEVSKLCWGFV